MTLKTLLLGSAAAFAVVGGAQAADLSVAEPVEYVKVCDYFGTGYFYIPGTDTCLRISGYVEENAVFHSNEVTAPGHSSSWNFSNVFQMDVSTKSMTEYGELDGLVSFGGGGGGPGSGYNSVTLGDDGAYVSLGGFKAGAYQLAAWNAVYAVTDNHGPVNNEIYGTFQYASLSTFQLNWAAGGMSASLAVSDPQTYFGSALPTNYSVPLITGQIGWSMGGATANVSGGYVTLQAGGSWGVDGLLHFNLGKADSIELNGAYGDNAFIQNGFGPGVNAATNNGYSVLGGWQHAFSPQLAFQAVGSWAKFSGTSATGYALNGDLVWTPVTNFSVTGAVVYSSNTSPSDAAGAWTASLSAKRSW